MLKFCSISFWICSCLLSFEFGYWNVNFIFLHIKSIFTQNVTVLQRLWQNLQLKRNYVKFSLKHLIFTSFHLFEINLWWFCAIITLWDFTWEFKKNKRYLILYLKTRLKIHKIQLCIKNYISSILLNIDNNKKTH